MYNLTYPDRNIDILWNSDWIKFVVEMCMEHYSQKLSHTALLINPNPAVTVFYKQKYQDQKVILYNLEHHYPCKGLMPNNINKTWYGYLVEQIPYADEIWDFNIEDYIFYERHGAADKFIFMPLRYTTWFERFHSNKEPRYELELEAVFDTQLRVNIIHALTTAYANEKRLKLKLANTDDMDAKYSDKLDAKWNLDVPHWDDEETINVTRICESICLNKPVICFDLYNVGSHAYFDDLVVYTRDLSSKHVKELVDMDPPQNVAQRFKDMTYLPNNYEEYRRKIKEDFERIANIKIPDSVLRNPLQ